MTMRWVFAVALAAALATGGCRPGTAATTATATATASQALAPLTIASANGRHAFEVEVARTEAEQERGLMYRTSIPANGGMIFPFSQAKIASFWMKNCPIPEDWLFIREDGTIAKIAENTIPYSLDPITSGEPVIAVLEIAGGRAAELGIVEGDRVIWQR